MAKKDYKKIASDIVQAVGGEENIASASHCMTRLRLHLKNESKLNVEEAKKIPGVLNLIQQNGEDQFVIGQDVAQLYEEVSKYNITLSGSVEDATTAAEDSKASKGNIVNAILSFIGGTFSPVIPVLVAGGLMGAVLTLLTTFFGVSTESGTYQVIYAINQATFYFLPVYIGYAAATRLKSNGYLGAFLAAILLYVTINPLKDSTFLGIPISVVSYNSTVFPIILGCLFLSVVYRFFQNHLPVWSRTIFVPLLTMLITVPVTLIVLGPIGNWAGTLLADGVYAIYNVVPAIAVALIGAFTCWMVFFGMNNATYPIVFALLAEVGSDPLICAGMAPANVAVGAACLAAALVAKKQEEKSVAIGAGVTAMCGITEPGVYGVLFVKRYPLIGAMLGGGIGGLICGLFGGTQYVISTPGFISFAAYISPDGTWNNFIIMMLCMVVAVVIAFITTYILGKKKEVNA
ncbi:MAG: PTS transporter subunit EIIC [Lactobacillus sp.]|nr:PTS transporter subunit EIIC [Lactobacillus sp.]